MGHSSPNLVEMFQADNLENRSLFRALVCCFTRSLQFGFQEINLKTNSMVFHQHKPASLCLDCLGRQFC
jgi:hypothetical protein